MRNYYNLGKKDAKKRLPRRYTLKEGMYFSERKRAIEYNRGYDEEMWGTG